MTAQHRVLTYRLHLYNNIYIYRRYTVVVMSSISHYPVGAHLVLGNTETNQFRSIWLGQRKYGPSAWWIYRLLLYFLMFCTRCFCTNRVFVLGTIECKCICLRVCVIRTGFTPLDILWSFPSFLHQPLCRRHRRHKFSLHEVVALSTRTQKRPHSPSRTCA